MEDLQIFTVDDAQKVRDRTLLCII